MNILIVDDQANILRTTSYALRSMGHVTHTAENSRQAIRLLEEEPIDALFLDVMLGSENGLEVLSDLRAREFQQPVIVFTAQASIESAVEAMRRGAYDYIQKPFIPEEIKQKLARLEGERQVLNRVRNLEGQVAESHPTLQLESEEPIVRRAFETAFRAAPSEATILVLGPSGTGKTVLARSIHERSRRKDQAFVTINCPSLSRELLESELFGHVKGAFTGAMKDTWGKVAAADGGTLFLDEIGELPLEIQPKLLRLLQDREYERLGDTKTRKADIRLIAATNRDLAAEVGAGRFREDLFYRLKVITIEMPALADRPSDLVGLAENYLRFFAKTKGQPRLKFSRPALEAITHYPWPGNLRELRNVIERAVIMCRGDEIVPEDLPGEFHENRDTAIRPGYLVSIQDLENEHIRRILAKAPSLERAASILGIDTATLYRKRKRMGLL
ncbi:sigma-54-dependent response regulator transcription factor AlgB [Opitutales bacterium ASA1]|jgi:NtrC-family two-component system response regulator AlgB|uniref:sigma-54-dependent transcriptional regulator n=1 Tax=Congregicoccus parvus TaxID=3081749 RepID=UPI002B2DE52A|nr:sigma-54-dependent response regulator transcription factor AlgB [Opitutales bacterium ASA1]